MRAIPLTLSLVLGGCATAPVAEAPPMADDDDSAALGCGAGWEVVSFPTQDGETLQADWRPAERPGAGLMVLLHMIPPSNDRSGYPLRIRDALAGEGVAVLNVDRRGAGGSTGEAVDAYTGPGGELDVEAALRFALDPSHGCAVDRQAVTLVGASNGTTSVYDYTVAHAADLPHPAAVVFMSPGGYTAANHPFSPAPSQWTADLSLPFLWLHPTTEPWSNGFTATAPSSWEFIERGTMHGTRMFDGGTLEEATLTDLLRWLPNGGRN